MNPKRPGKKKKPAAKKKSKSRAPVKPAKKVAPRSRKGASIESTLQSIQDTTRLKRQLSKMGEELQRSQERVQDIEIHLNLLTRLLTTLCVEKFGMRVGVLKRIIREIEKEAIRDSQIHHLENLYQLPSRSNKRTGGRPPSDSKDRWDDIS